LAKSWQKVRKLKSTDKFIKAGNSVTVRRIKEKKEKKKEICSS
jgi:hypothetical protein